MALPKRRHSKTRRDKRRTHWRLATATVIDCPRCHASRVAHHVCPNCGFYNGRLVLEIKERKKKQK